MRSFDASNADTRTIVDAVQEIQSSPELQAQARTDLPGLLDRLKLSGVARHAVASGLALGLVVASGPVAHPNGFWN